MSRMRDGELPNLGGGTWMLMAVAVGLLVPLGEPRFGSASGLRGIAAQVPVDVEVGGSREVLSGDREPWEDYWVRVTYRPEPGTFVYGTWRHTRRFGREDQRYEAGAGMPLADRWSARLDGTWSPTHRVAPLWGASGSISYRPATGWTLSAGGGREVWESSSVNRQHLGIDRRVGRFGLGYRLGFHQSEPQGSGLHHRVAGSLFYGDPGSSVTLQLGTGREAVVVGPGELRSTNARSARLSGIHRLDARTGIAYDFGVYRHGPHFTRTTSSVGIRRQL